MKRFGGLSETLKSINIIDSTSTNTRQLSFANRCNLKTKVSQNQSDYFRHERKIQKLSVFKCLASTFYVIASEDCRRPHIVSRKTFWLFFLPCARSSWISLACVSRLLSSLSLTSCGHALHHCRCLWNVSMDLVLSEKVLFMVIKNLPWWENAPRQCRHSRPG